eukprot:scaffold229565_cov31-Prasinocladus_malaysianus.AAC.1
MEREGAIQRARTESLALKQARRDAQSDQRWATRQQQEAEQALEAAACATKRQKDAECQQRCSEHAASQARKLKEAEIEALAQERIQHAAWLADRDLVVDRLNAEIRRLVGLKGAAHDREAKHQNEMRAATARAFESGKAAALKEIAQKAIADKMMVELQEALDGRMQADNTQLQMVEIDLSGRQLKLIRPIGFVGDTAEFNDVESTSLILQEVSPEYKLLTLNLTSLIACILPHKSYL